jgi:hypothetical protein
LPVVVGVVPTTLVVVVLADIEQVLAHLVVALPQRILLPWLRELTFWRLARVVLVGLLTLVAIKVLPQLLVLSRVLAVALAVVKTVVWIQLWVVPVVGVRHPMLVLRVLLGRVTLVETLVTVAVAVVVVALVRWVWMVLPLLEMTAVPVLLQRLQVLVLLALVVVVVLALPLVLVVPVAVALVAVAGRLVHLER